MEEQQTHDLLKKQCYTLAVKYKGIERDKKQHINIIKLEFS